MRRIFARKDSKSPYEFAGWSKPGTITDRLLRDYGDAILRIRPANMNIRQQRRAAQRGYIGAALRLAQA
jgi:hypothetical protein